MSMSLCVDYELVSHSGVYAPGDVLCTRLAMFRSQRL